MLFSLFVAFLGTVDPAAASTRPIQNVFCVAGDVIDLEYALDGGDYLGWMVDFERDFSHDLLIRSPLNRDRETTGAVNDVHTVCAHAMGEVSPPTEPGKGTIGRISAQDGACAVQLTGLSQDWGHGEASLSGEGVLRFRTGESERVVRGLTCLVNRE